MHLLTLVNGDGSICGLLWPNVLDAFTFLCLLIKLAYIKQVCLLYSVSVSLTRDTIDKMFGKK